MPIVSGAALALALGAGTLATLFAGASRGQAGPEPAPPGAGVPVVLTQLPAGTAAETGGARGSGMRRADAGEGARLVLLQPDGSTRVLSEGFASACDPDVSHDGTRVVFAGRRAAGDPWGVYELTLASGAIRQVTRELGDCRSPHYHSTYYTITEPEPWEQIGFLSTRAGHRDEVGGAPATNLFTCKLDGTFVQRITYDLSSDADPVLLDDGRLLYATWRRASLEDGPLGRVALETINVDGSDPAPFVGRVGRRVQHMPCVTPGGLAVFVESDAVGWDGAGLLSSASMRRPLHSYRPLTKPDDGLFHSPAPLPDGGLLVAWRPADGSGTLGLYRFDPATGERTRLLDDPAFHEMQAKAVAPRARRLDGRSSVVDESDPEATLYGIDVYLGDLNGLKRGEVKALRVIAADPTVPDAGAGLAARRTLIEVPVHEDGSYQIKVPANVPFQLQAIDADGLALRSCGWVWARSHQAQGCIGCHEDAESTPPNRMPKALYEPAPSAVAAAAGASAIDFRHDVAPIVAARCATCHGPGGAAPRLDGDPADATAARRAYDALLAGGEAAAVHPGRARTSPLVRHVLGRNPARPWDGDATKRTTHPIPADGAAVAPTEAERAILLRWIDTGAAWDAHPAPGATR